MLLPLMVCPSCKGGLKPNIKGLQTVLVCLGCDQLTPVVNGFPLFNESDFESEGFTQRRHVLQKKFDDFGAYSTYRENKLARHTIEIYAAFQPFNESSRAIYPFIDTLKSQLQPGQLIIDTWSRTGWSALLLAAFFPDQQVVAIWEKDNSVLGYAGYSYWFAEDRRPANLSIIFLGAEQALPFPDSSAALIHGHDVVHRRPFKYYITDLVRVSDPEGTILLPHIHLSNCEPNPYFPRGGELRHGLEYTEFLTNLLAGEKRTAMVLSEPDLFAQQRPVTLNDAAAGDDYNALIILAVDTYFKAPLSENWLLEFNDNARAVINPLLIVCPFTHQVLLNKSGLGDQLDYLLTRHPIYEDKLKKILPRKLSSLEYTLLLSCELGHTLAEIFSKSKITTTKVKKILLALVQCELISLLPLPAIAIELQNFHTNHHRLSGESFNTAWQRMLDEQPDCILMTFDNAPLSVIEMAALINGWRCYLQLRGNIGQLKITRKSDFSLPLVMACWLENIVVETWPQLQIGASLTFSNTAGEPVQIINEKDEELYWELLEPFLDENLLPFPPEAIINAKVDNQPWQQWYIN
jgi:uncharacterized protein YbaR (Trm112 family)